MESKFAKLISQKSFKINNLQKIMSQNFSKLNKFKTHSNIFSSKRFGNNNNGSKALRVSSVIELHYYQSNALG